MSKIVIAGASGFLGSHLKIFLQKHGFEVIALDRGQDWPPQLEGAQIVINLSGHNIAAWRWNKKQKQLIFDSRVKTTQKIAEILAHQKNKPALFISQSATGYYGDRASELLVESSKPGTDFLAQVCVKWEAAAKPARDAGIRVVNTRSGVVLNKDGGALKKMLPVIKLGLGGILGDGHQYFSWISLNDWLRAMLHIIQTPSIEGPINLVAQPVTNSEFTKTLARSLGRPAFFRVPAFALKLAVGELADSLLASIRAVPKKLLESGFKFETENLSF